MWCSRCGRYGHTINTCYARTNSQGRLIRSPAPASSQSQGLSRTADMLLFSDADIQMTKKRLLVITGYRNPGRADHIKTSMEKQGYEVTVITHDQYIAFPEQYDLVIGHSAGAATAVGEFAGTDIPVVALNSPYRRASDNVTYVNGVYDPIAYLQYVNPFAALSLVMDDETQYVRTGHSKEDTFNHWYNSQYPQM